MFDSGARTAMRSKDGARNLDTGGAAAVAKLHRRELVSWFRRRSVDRGIRAPALSSNRACPRLLTSLP